MSPPPTQKGAGPEGPASDSSAVGIHSNHQVKDNHTAGQPLDLAATLALLPYDFEIELQHKLSTSTFTDLAGRLLEDGEANRIRLDDFDLVSEVHFTLPDPNQIPLPDHLRVYKVGDIGGAIPDPAPETLLGPIGEWLQLVEPETEASVASLGGGLLAGLGSWLGRQVTLQVGRVVHRPNLLAVQIGRTRIARKGTADAEILGFLKLVDP